MKTSAFFTSLFLLFTAPALADSSATIEFDPNAPFKPEPNAVLRSAPLAMALDAALPALIVSLGLLRGDPKWMMGTAIAAPTVAGVGQMYAGDPARGLATGLMGPVVVGAGWGIGTMLGQSATGPNNGMWTALGLYIAYAMTDAYTSADLANKKALYRAGGMPTP